MAASSSPWYQLASSKEAWWPRISGAWLAEAKLSGVVCSVCERFVPERLAEIGEVRFAPLDEPVQMFPLMIGAVLVASDFYASLPSSAPPHTTIKCVNSRTGETMPYRCLRAQEPVLLWIDGVPAARRCTSCAQWVPRISEHAYLQAADTVGVDVLYAIAGVYVRSPELAPGWRGRFVPRAVSL